MPNKRYGQQTPIHDDSDARSSSQSPSSNGKHDDPLDFRPAENSPMIGGGRTYQEHDLWLYDYQIEERRSVWSTAGYVPKLYLHKHLHNDIVPFL